MIKKKNSCSWRARVSKSAITTAQRGPIGWKNPRNGVSWTVSASTVHWVGRQLPDEVHARPDPPEVSAVPEAAWWSDSWTDPWNGQDGIWAAAETDFSQDEVKELEEAYAVYEGKLRTFAQARALMKNKAVGRGFFPTAKGTYGKSKNKKGKGYGSAPVLAASSPTRKGPGKVGSPDYSGCFIWGEGP